MTTPPHKIVTLAAAWPHLPGKLRQAIEAHYRRKFKNEADFADELEALKQYHCVWFEGDVNLDRDTWQAISKDDGWGAAMFGGRPRMVVGGTLRFDGTPPSECFVGGDLICDAFHVQGDSTLVGGKAVARHYAYFGGPDDEILHKGFHGQVDTPLAFFWFHDWRTVTLPPDSVVSVVCPFDDFEEPDTPFWFYWSEDLYALRPELCLTPHSWSSDEWHWNFDAIHKTMAAGESPFIDGFDLACLPLLHRAFDHRRQKQYKEAFLCAKEAIRLSPGYHRAWRDAGLALYSASALAQAVPYFERAVALAPQKFASLPDKAANELALALLRLKEWDRAIALTTPLIERIQHDRDDDLLSVLFRVRGEAWLKKGDLAQARVDLERAAKLDWRTARYQWLAGLVCHMQGDTERAAHYRERACRHRDDGRYARFDGFDGSDAFYDPPTSVDWETLRLADLPGVVRDADYWRDYLHHKGYDTPKSFRAIPAEFLTRDFCLYATEHCPRKADGDVWVARYFPQTVFDEELAGRLIDLGAVNLQYVPERLITKALLMRADSGCYDIARVPVGLIDAELARKLVERQVPVDALPPSLVDNDLCRHAVRHWSHAADHVPGRFKDEDFWLTALAWADSSWFIRNQVPPCYLEPAMICRALTLNFGLIHQLPGRFVDEQVFAHAQSICPDAALWAQLAETHGPDFRRHDSDADCAEHCWEVYWDEPLILAEIDHDGYHLPPYEIPPAKYTQQIADAAFRRDPIHLRSIPRRFITSQMAEEFVREYADMLHDVPLAERSRKVCEIAAIHSWDKGKFFAHVPIAHRTEGVCIAALKKCADNAEHIPLALRYAVYDRLLAEGDDEFSRAWLITERGMGALAQGRLDAALADFDAVLQKKLPVSPPKRRGLLDVLFKRDKQAQTEEQEIDEDDLALARLYKVWALRRSGRSEDAGLLAQMSEEERALLDCLDLTEPHDAFEFDLAAYEQHMQTAGQSIEAGDYAGALAAASGARQCLEAAHHPDPHLWAYVLDHLRFITWELGQYDENESLCREVLERLKGHADWPYLEHDNIIRATRRAAHNTLAWRLVDDPQADRDDIACALDHARAAFRRSPIEEEETVQTFYVTLAKVLLAAAAFDDSLRAETDAVLARIRDLDLLERGLVTDPTVLEALGSPAP